MEEQSSAPDSVRFQESHFTHTPPLKSDSTRLRGDMPGAMFHVELYYTCNTLATNTHLRIANDDIIGRANRDEPVPTRSLRAWRFLWRPCIAHLGLSKVERPFAVHPITLPPDQPFRLLPPRPPGYSPWLVAARSLPSKAGSGLRPNSWARVRSASAAAARPSAASAIPRLRYAAPCCGFSFSEAS